MTEIKDILNLKNLLAKFCFANTPAYLFKNFKQDETVVDISKKYTTTQLIDEFIKIEASKDFTFDNLTILYAIIMALSFKPNAEVNSFFSDLPNRGIRWSDKIAYLYFSNLRGSIDMEFTTGETPSPQNSPNISVTVV